MSGAISIGTTGLTSSSKQMDVIGNNLANANTLGYKSGSTYFASMLNQSLSSGGAMQVGSGVAVAAVATQFTQGSFENTGNATDLAIDGEGFFMVKDKEGAQYFTRAGAFHIAETGILEDNNGYQVQGYNNATMDFDSEDKLSSISLKGVQSKPKATTLISMGVNLDETAVGGDKFNVSQTVFDSKGMQHNLSTTYQKTEKAGTWGYTIKLDDTNTSTGQSADGVIFDKNGDIAAMFHGEMDAATVTTTGTGAVSTQSLLKAGQIYKSTTSPIVITENGDGSGIWSVTNKGGYDNLTISTQESGKIKVDLDGAGGTDLYFDISAVATWKDGDTISFNLTKTDVPVEDQVLQFDSLGKDPLDPNNPTIGVHDPSTNKNKITWAVASDTAEHISGYASGSAVGSLSNDGYTSGVLKSISIGSDGIISGAFTNGQTSNLGKVMLANFTNAGGLRKIGNYFGATQESGEAIKNTAGSGGLGAIMSCNLEISNTDTAKEFVDMITAQRAYQASARVITTADQLLTELMNIKR